MRKSGGNIGARYSPSINDIQDENNTIIEEALTNSLNLVAETCPNESDKLDFLRQMKDFQQMFNMFLTNTSNTIDWDKIKSPPADMIIPHKDIKEERSDEEIRELLSKLAVLKLNGGLGTSMGCTGPKSAITVHSGCSFLDLTVRQIEALNTRYNVNVPLVLMNSFNTDEETDRILRKFKTSNVTIYTFNQNRFPRIYKESLEPCCTEYNGNLGEWYPPGHGDVYQAFYNSEVFNKLVNDKKEYIFFSNIDNLGATVDADILAHIIKSNAEFIMEVTDKTRSDVKGGTLIDYEGKAKLLEIAQVPSNHVEEFKSIKKFKIFNTNNMWVKLSAIKEKIESHQLSTMDVIVNGKEYNNRPVIQLERAAGAAIEYFKNSHGVNVPRSRFLPVKSTSDLFVVQSNIYTLSKGKLIINPKRPFTSIPLVKLGTSFKSVTKYLDRFSNIPDILELDHLTVSGDVTFGKNVTLRGTVIIVANHGERIDIPSGAILENKVVSGNLRILDH